MTDIKPLALAAALTAVQAAQATAATVPRPEPIPVYDGLLMYPDHIQGRHAFGPADGIELWLGKGKGDHLLTVASAPRIAPQRTSGMAGVTTYDNSQTQRAVPFWTHGGGGTFWVGGCGCPSGHTPPDDLPRPPSQVPLPSAALLLMSALGFVAIRRSRG